MINNNKMFLTVDDQVILYNALTIAAKRVAKFDKTNEKYQNIEKALKICYEKGFPHSDGPEEIELENKLINFCRNFISEQKISCAETVYQSDRVIENAYDFIYGICKIVGFHNEKD